VIQHTLGIDITHDMFQQVQMGSPVDRSDLQPGDLVFFQNTFRPGLSHVGVYIGNGQMVNAENESTGVVVSDINSDYYSSRFYAARRLW
jgi:cell wall-associated NlpC family hydrolase